MSNIECKGAVLRGVNDLRVETITVLAPTEEEVMVKMTGCGICLSDGSIVNGHIRSRFPQVLGHEGAGIVCQVGKNVDDIAVGDPVVLSLLAVCGRCDRCAKGRTSLCVNMNARKPWRMQDKEGKNLTQMSGTGCMAEYTTVHRLNCIKVDPKIPLETACLVGCGVTTGTGSVFNRAQVKPGITCACIGTGGVGLNVIQACKIAGAKTIIAVDLLDSKLEAAKKFGATHVVNPTKDGDAVKAIRAICKGGVDYAFEVIGMAKTYEQAFEAISAGGMAVGVGVAGDGEKMTIPAVLNEKTWTTAIYGSCNPSVDFPRLLDLYQGGKLMLDELVTRTYTIDETKEGFDDLFAGKNLRGVISFGANPKL